MRRGPLRSIPYYVFFLSGIAGLGYEMVWTRMFTVGLGHEMPSVLAVVTAFFAGIALGGWMLDGPIARSAQSARWYAALEAVIGVWGLASIVLIPIANELAVKMIGVDPSPQRHWLIAFAIPLLTILPATFAMGATLPAMDRIVAAQSSMGRVIGGLYAVNTGGAVTGIVISTWWLMPAFGFRITVIALAAINLICAAWMWAMQTPSPSSEGEGWGEGARRHTASGRQRRPHAPSPLTPLPRGEGKKISCLTSEGTGWRDCANLPRARLFASIFLTGLLGIGYEVLAIRTLAQVTQNTIYSFAYALSIYLLATALGAAIYQWLLVRRRFEPVLSALALGLTITCLAGAYVLASSLDLYERLREWLGSSASAAMAVEAILAGMVFALPCLFMGATFAHLVQAARRQSGGVGRAVALNTIGAAIAPALFGVWLLPLCGARISLLVVALGYGAILPRLTRVTAPMLLAAILLAFLAPPIQLVHAPQGGRLRDFRDGVMASVAVVEDSNGERFLKVNNRFQMGGTIGIFSERRMMFIPILLHPSPQRALALGIGPGMTFGAAALVPNLQADGVELIPEVLEALSMFEPHNNAPQRQANLRLHAADARRFIRASANSYDVIVGDLFHPGRDGAGMLYTVEHFRAMRDRLAPGGIACQWLPLYQLDDEMIRVIGRTFIEVFPHTRAFIAQFNVEAPVLGLIGTVEKTVYPMGWMKQRVDDFDFARTLEPLVLDSDIQLFGCLVAGEDQWREYVESARVNTDDHPIVLFQAPRFAYIEASATTYGRLEKLLRQFKPNAIDLIEARNSDDARFVVRVNNFIMARNVFLEGMIEQSRGEMAAAVDQWIRSAALSGDFNTGYALCMEIARTQAKSNPAFAQEILRKLVNARPQDERLIQRMWQSLFGAPPN